MEQSESISRTAPILRNRIVAVDITRGLVMVIMALDHVRDLLHSTAMTQNPTDLTTTTAPLFLTRWITHLCAPTFVFLSGTSAYLSLKKQTPANQRTGPGRWFLLKRGVVLILLELTVVNFGLWFDIRFHSLMLQVIYAIGGGLIVVSVLARLPAKGLGLIGLVLVFGHNLLAGLAPFTYPAVRFVWALLVKPDFFVVSPSFGVFVAYPLLPWLGILLLGYWAGQLVEQPKDKRPRNVLRVGLGALALFGLLRFMNGYGDPAPWAVQKDALFTVLSFINVTKYPPSLLYTLLFVGLALIVLFLTDGADKTLTRVLTVYGKVPMFYYIVHWYVVHLTMLGMIALQGYALTDLSPGILDIGRPKGAGISLGSVYLVWIGLVVALYPLCRWYGRYKAAHPTGWLRYL